MIEHSAPKFSIKDALSFAQEIFGLGGQITGLPSHLDQNFRLETDQDIYVLKIVNGASESSYLDLQQSVLSHLQQSESFGNYPVVVPTIAGDSQTVIEGIDGESHQIWMVTWLEGRTLATIRPLMKHLLKDIGRFLGNMDHALEGFDHESAHRDYPWDLRKTHLFERYLDCIQDSERRSIVEASLEGFQSQTLPSLDSFRQSVIHHDANDHNILIQKVGYETHVSGLIDFGDTLHTATVIELAIAVAYIMMNKADPVGAAAEVIGGYHEMFPLEEWEISILFELIRARLCGSVLVSAYRGALEPENEYIRVSEQGAWSLLTRLAEESCSLAEYRWRSACGMEPCSKTKTIFRLLKETPFSAIMHPDVRSTDPLVLDLSVGSPLSGAPDMQPDLHRASDAWFRRIRRAGSEIGIGRYNEPRIVYTAHHYLSPNNEFHESRTIHLGIDLFKESGTPIYAPISAIVHSLHFCSNPMDFGGLIILEHTIKGETFYTLYGHLSQASIEGLHVGQEIAQGQEFAYLGSPQENGGWIPHLHFQIITDLLGESSGFWGVAPASQREVWLSICPDPNLLLGVQNDKLDVSDLNTERIQSRRKELLGGNLSVSYRTPLHIVRGYRQYLYDITGRRFLDAVNNVPHVGHSHPKVNSAAIRQMHILNTNTRYLHQTLVDYAERLTATMPDPLRICYFVNSGSEANDLALRLAYAHTGRQNIVVLEGAYHGHLSSLIAISPYKFNGPGGTGEPPHVFQASVPDVYRGRYRGIQAAEYYAKQLKTTIETAKGEIAAFICESLLGCGGQIELPDGYLSKVYAHVREAGGVCIADEVQVGFGRMGSHFWGFQTQQVVPDIVVLGKPMGNGHPLAGVVTTPEIAQSFNNGMEFFSTFGGNPVSCMTGMAVLDVIESEGLQENALITGQALKRSLDDLKHDYPIIGDIRGHGLFLGIELVSNSETLAPADKSADYIVNRMCDLGVLTSTDGPHHNVIKIKPPLVFDQNNASEFIEALDMVLQEDGAAITQ